MDVIKQIDGLLANMPTITGYPEIKAALTVLQKIASGDDCFPIETMEDHVECLVTDGETYAVAEKIDGCFWKDGLDFDYGNWDKEVTYWKPLDGAGI